ncbi:MAG: AAA family ATPase, partial [Patescibacteria group bacterium]|nr:AAA family ATPase [Patescibacteria group bacterium]
MTNNVYPFSAAAVPRIPPFNTEAEQALLGAIFINNRVYEHVVDIVAPADFGNAVHAQIFDAIGKMMERGIPANPVTLKPLFDQDDSLKPIGGSQYLIRIAGAAVSAITAPDYARLVADLSLRRYAIAAAEDLLADAYTIDPDRSASVILDEAQQNLSVIAERQDRGNGPVSIGSIVADTVRKIDETYKNGAPAVVDTGLVDLDRLIGGMSGGNLVILAGRTGMGKSVAAGTIALNVARSGKRVLFFSLEMTAEELSARWLAGETGISVDRQRHAQLEGPDWNRLVEAEAVIAKLPISVDHQPRLGVAAMRQRARRLRRRFGLDLIIVDHLQLIRQPGKQESRR